MKQDRHMKRKQKIDLLKGITKGTVSKQDLKGGKRKIVTRIILECNDGSGNYYVSGMPDIIYTPEELQRRRENNKNFLTL